MSFTGDPTWLAQGPGPINNGNNVIMTNSPQAGAIEAIAADPSNGNRVFVATVDGGVWRTLNALDVNPNWTPLTDQFPSLSMGAISFDPNDSTNNTLWAGSGLFSNGRGDGGQQIGLLKTTDGGDTWTQFGQNQLTGQNVESVLGTTASVGGKEVVLAASDNSGVWRSTDGGVTFANVSTGGLNNPPFGSGVSQLVGDSGDANRFYAAIPGAGVWTTDDAGATWSQDNGGGGSAITGLAGTVRIELSVSPAAGNPVYVGLIGSDGKLASVWRSGDSGANWASIGTAPDINQGGQGGVNFAILADRSDANVVYVAGDRGPTDNAGNVFQGNAGTNTWAQFDHGGANNTAPHPDSRDLAFDANGDILQTDDGGIYRLVNPNSGARVWVSELGNITPTEFYNVSYDSLNNVIFGGAQDNGSPEQPTPGSLVWDDQTGADGTLTAVDNTSDPGHSIHYYGTQNFGGFQRKTFDSADNLTDTHAISLTVNGTGGENLFTVESNGGTSTVRFVQPFALNVVDPTRLIVGTNFLYESTDQGDDLTSLGGVMDTGGGNFKATGSIGSVDPVGSGGGIHGSPIAYGGFDHGVGNADLLWVGGGGKLWLRTSGTGAPAQVAAYPGATVQDIALDPNNWHTAFVIDTAGKVWRTTDTGATWTNLTGNLTVATDRLRTVLAIDDSSGIHQSLLVGGDQGVFRAIDPGTTATWSKFGTNLPNSVTKDLEYDPANDVLLAGTWGRGAWTVQNASSSLYAPGVLEVDGTSLDDKIRLVIDSNNPLLLDVFVNNNSSVPDAAVPLAGITQINVNGLGGNDTLTVDSTNGLISVPNGIRYDGGTGSNALQLVQNGGSAHTTDVYSVGPNSGEGSSVISDPGAVQSVSFQNLAPVLDLVPSAAFTVNGTNANNAVTFGQGSIVTDGLISVDNFEPIEFANKTSLTINSLGGSDHISLNDPSTPTGLAAITVNGGDPTDSDTLVVNGIPGALDNLRLIPSGVAAGQVVDDSAVMPVVSFSGIENLTMAGQQTDGDGFRIDGTGGNDAIEFTSGASPDRGTFTGTMDQNNATGNGPFTLVTTTFIGASPLANDVDVNFFNASGSDSFTFNGTAGDDKIQVATGEAGGTEFRNTIAGQVAARLEVFNINSAKVRGLGGNDTFNVSQTALSAAGPLSIEENGSSGASVANLTGSGAAAQALLGPTSTVTGAGLGTVTLAGLNAINLAAGAGAVTITGGTGPNSFNVAVGSPTTTTVTGDGPTFTSTNTGSLTLNGAAPSVANSLTLKTTGAASVNFTPTGPSAGTILAGATGITLGNIESFIYNGQSGNAALTVTGNASANTFTVTPGATNDAGTVAMDLTLPVTFQNLGAGASLALNGNGGPDSLVYNGTAAADAFSVNNAGTGGVVNLNARIPVNTSSTITTATLNGLAGDDSFTLIPAVQDSVYTLLTFNGGSAASPTGNTASLVGTAGNDSFVVSGQSVTLGPVTVNSTGMTNIALDAKAGTNTITYNGVAGTAEAINVIGSSAAGSGKVSVPGVTLVTFANTQQLAVNGNPADSDTVTFTGTNASETYNINLNAAGTATDPVLKLLSGSTNLLTLLNYTGVNTLNISGLDGTDVFNVYTGTSVGRNIAITGNLPAGKKKLTDLVNVFYVMPRPKIVQSTATQSPASGLVSLQYSPLVTDLIQYSGIENVTIKKL